MSELIDLSGMRFGHWYVIEQDKSPHPYGTKWIVRCACGNTASVSSTNLRGGRPTQCRRCVSAMRQKHGGRPISSPIYGTWLGMHRRCEHTNYKGYSEYGGRGIEVCAEWTEYSAFYDWSLENGWQKGLTLDRIDCNGNYSPDNCRWTDWKTQERNRRNTRRAEYAGIEMSLAAWAEFFHVEPQLFYNRYRAGWDIERIVREPNNAKYGTSDESRVCRSKAHSKYFTIDGVTKSTREWADEFGIDPNVIHMRIRRGWTVEKAITAPLTGSGNKNRIE